MKILLLVAYCLILTYADDDDMFAVDKKGGRKHYCGTDLRLNLMFLCESIYKRSAPDRPPGHDNNWMMSSMGMDDTQVSSHFPFRSHAKAVAMFPHHLYLRRQTRGVADECCSKACTIAELATYCGPRPS